jgi:hypothetical protein
MLTFFKKTIPIKVKPVFPAESTAGVADGQHVIASPRNPSVSGSVCIRSVPKLLQVNSGVICCASIIACISASVGRRS